jgi:uncharacterized protein YceH (UPF0502 family)
MAGKMSHVTDGDLLSEAVAELYSSDPDEFVERRGALVARARGLSGLATRRAAAPSAEEVRAERERRHRAAVAEAEQAASEASQTADAATTAEHELEATVQRLEEELADARQALAGARVQARRARTRQRSAQQALDRLL